MPHAWSFFLAIFSYRAYLFEIGVGTKFWIVYRINEDARVVHVLRVWNATRDPNAFRVS